MCSNSVWSLNLSRVCEWTKVVELKNSPGFDIMLRLEYRNLMRL